MAIVSAMSMSNKKRKIRCSTFACGDKQLANGDAPRGFGVLTDSPELSAAISAAYLLMRRRGVTGVALGKILTPIK